MADAGHEPTVPGERPAHPKLVGASAWLGERLGVGVPTPPIIDPSPAPQGTPSPRTTGPGSRTTGPTATGPTTTGPSATGPSATVRRRQVWWRGRRRRPDGVPAPAIEPRLEERRRQIAHDQGRRRRRVSIGIATGLAGTAAMFWAARSPLLSVRHLRVLGAVHTSSADVGAAAGLGGRRLMVDLDAPGVARAIERLPWVARASVTRRWPDSLVVHVTERAAVAVVGVPTAAPPAPGPATAGAPTGVVVDAAGRVLAPASAASPYPLVELATAAAVAGGVAGTEVDGRLLPGLAVAAAMPALLVPHVRSVSVGDGGHVSLALAGGASASLGEPTDLARKLDAVLTLIEKVRIGAGTIDATVPSAPVLTGSHEIAIFSTNTGG